MSTNMAAILEMAASMAISVNTIMHQQCFYIACVESVEMHVIAMNACDSYVGY